MRQKDLQNIKAFMAGVVLASLAKTREGGQREQSTCQSSNRSKHTAAPISLSVLADTLEVCESTAFKLRKLAHKCGYVNNEQNLSEIINWTPDQLIELKEQGLTELPVKRRGYAHKKNFRVERIRFKKNKLFVQEPNNVKALVPLKSRRGLSKYSPIDT